MKNIGIVIDSFSGFTEQEVHDFGFEYLPLQINVQGENKLEGIQVSNVEVLMQIRNGKECKTSLPPYGYMEKAMQEWAKKYDLVYIFPLNSNLSSEYSFLKTIAKNIDEKKFIIYDNNFDSYQYIWVGKHILKMNKEGKNDKEILKFITEYNESSLNYIIPPKLDALINGGRLKKYQKFILTSLKLIPIIKNHNGVTHDGIKKTMRSAVSKSVEKLIAFIGGEKNIKFYDFWLINTGDQHIVDLANEALAEYNIKPVFNTLGASSIMIHAGIDGISIGTSKKI